MMMMMNNNMNLMMKIFIGLFVLGFFISSTNAAIDPNYTYEFPPDSALQDFSAFLVNAISQDSCRVEGEACWLVLDAEPSNQFSDCCQDVTNGDGKVLACNGNPFWARCEFVDPDPNQKDPKGIKGVDWNVYDVATAGTPYDDCPAVSNLGPLFSKSTGYTEEPFPLLGTPSFLEHPYGREAEIGFFVGGSYVATIAAEIEGNILVLENFEIGARGTNSLGWAGVGSGIYAEEGVFMRVGGDLIGARTEGQTNAQIGGSIEVGGQCLSSPSTPNQCGSLFTQPGSTIVTQKTLDKAPWEALFEDFKVRSEYWYKLKPNGKYVTRGGGPNQNTMVLYAGDDQCVQVFTLDRFALEEAYSIALDKTLADKTILINVSPYNRAGEIDDSQIKWTGAFFDPWGGNDRTFSSVTKASMLWNFYGAKDVTLGGPVPRGSAGGIQFPGTVLVPHGNLNLLWPGQDGRTIVKGNVLHESEGSEFHNYEFDPPCPLPLPPGYPNPCATGTPTAPPTGVTVTTTIPPTMSPTAPPTSNRNVFSIPATGRTTGGGCPVPNPIPNPGSDFCPSDNGVTILSVLGVAPTQFDKDVVFDITPLDGGNSVSLKINNPFDKDLKVFVKYDKPTLTDGYGGYTFCEDDSLGPCEESSLTIEAACLHAKGNPFTLLQVYFVDETSSSIFGLDDVKIDQCCYHEDLEPDAVAQYSVLIRCLCPQTTAARRRLRSIRNPAKEEVEAAVFDADAIVKVLETAKQS